MFCLNASHGQNDSLRMKETSLLTWQVSRVGRERGGTGQEGAGGETGGEAAWKGYGLHTILMHQFRGLVVCFKQKKTTGAKSG